MMLGFNGKRREELPMFLQVEKGNIINLGDVKAVEIEDGETVNLYYSNEPATDQVATFHGDTARRLIIFFNVVAYNIEAIPLPR